MIGLALPTLDLAAFGLFLACLFSYGRLANRVVARRPSLVTSMRAFRYRWIERMSERDLHVADAALLGNLLRGTLFFASTTVFILGGLVALLGTAPKISEVIGQLPYASDAGQRLAEIKALILILIYVYAFFKFTWSAWQYNLLAILIGAMPKAHEESDPKALHREAAATVLVLAGENFNNGIRAYYFSIPLMSWLINPSIFIATTLIVTFVLYRREFHTPIIAALRKAEASIPTTQGSSNYRPSSHSSGS